MPAWPLPGALVVLCCGRLPTKDSPTLYGYLVRSRSEATKVFNDDAGEHSKLLGSSSLRLKEKPRESGLHKFSKKRGKGAILETPGIMLQSAESRLHL